MCGSSDSKAKVSRSVEYYDVATATLHLRHKCPASQTPVEAHVNLAPILESVVRVEVEIGSWLNVIGTIAENIRGTELSVRAADCQSGNRRRTPSRIVHVQALMLWSAGGINVADYERALYDREAAERA